MSLKEIELLCGLFSQMRGDLVCARLSRLEQGWPAPERKSVGALKREVSGGQVHPRERLPDLAAMADVGASYPYSVEKCDNGRGTPREFPERRAGAIADGLGTVDSALRQMLHETDKER